MSNSSPWLIQSTTETQQEVGIAIFKPENIDVKAPAVKKVIKICDTPQGSIKEAICTSPFKISRSVEFPANVPITIKTSNKILNDNNISYPDQDNMEFCCDDDIIKEKSILKYLTVDNHAIDDYIVKFYDFTEDDQNYYLITESVNNHMNLKQFSEQARKHIETGRLNRKQYNKVIKYIFWQLSCALYWLHNDMHCCHLNLSMENVTLHNCGAGNSPFITRKNGSVSIHPKITPKMSDFSNAEIFKSADDFQCNKHNIFGENIHSVQFLSPQLYAEQTFDARAADLWSFGMILYECVIHRPLYTFIYNPVMPMKGSGYWVAFHHAIGQYLASKYLLRNVNTGMLAMINELIVFNAEQRLKSSEILKHKWFKDYYATYAPHLQSKSAFHKKQLTKVRVQQKMSDFPYYNGNDYC